MKTRTLIILVIAAIGIFSFFMVLDNLSNISSFFQHTLPTYLKNNPINHHFIISNIHNTKEYQTFDSKFIIYDEGIISTGSTLEYKVTANSNKTDNLLILNFKYSLHSDKIRTDIRCSVTGPDGIFHILPNNSYDDRVMYFIENTDCLKNTTNGNLDALLTSSIRVQTDKDVYNTNDVIVISGSVDKMLPNTEMIITISNPLENIIAVSQTNVVDSKFMGRFQIDGPLWKQNGAYTITVHYGEENIQTEFLFLSDLYPEKLL